MPWKESHVMEERFRWIEEWKQGETSLSALCGKYEVSRKTAYKYLRRYQEEGLLGLQDRTSAPHTHPNQVSAEVEQAVVELRLDHPTWGPKKLRAWLERERPESAWPARSTLGVILQRHGLNGKRRPKRQRASPSTEPLAHATTPNSVWCIDFKGWFRCGDGCRCDPLTVTDAASRYLLCCQWLTRTDTAYTQAALTRVFREYGLPERLRSDNGEPFASVGLGGLNALSVWWIKLGILPERIEPGEPQQNGRHERMHRTLKQETAAPAEASLRAQQRRFDQFRREYNEQRPHEALGQQTPAEHYRRSPRPFPKELPAVEYGPEFAVRVADESGKIRWKAARCRVGRALANELIGVRTIDDGLHQVYFGPQLLGMLDERRSQSGARTRKAGYWAPLQSPSGLLTRRPATTVIE
jgi:transposase InsO family protein